MDTTAQLEFKRASLDQEGKFTGYISTYGGEPDLHGDVILPGAFKQALAAHERDGTMPAMLWGHDQSEPIGRWLAFTDDTHGLLGTGQLTLKTRRGAEAQALLRDGAVSLSIGFQLAPDGAHMENGVRFIRHIARLHEISIVAIPANPKAKILESARSFEKALRETLGLSAKQAKRATAGGYRAIAVRDERSTDLDLVLAKIEELRNDLRERNKP